MKLEEYKQKPYNKQLWSLTVDYIKKCTNQQVFVNKKPSQSFWAIRSFFLKLEPSELPVLYGYVSSIKDKEYLSLTDLFHKSERLNQQRHMINISNDNVGDYQKKSVLDWLGD